VRFVRILISAVVACFAARAILLAQDASLRLAGEELRVSAPKLHFLSGKPLETLRNGTTVAFDIQVSILTDGKGTVLRRNFERFVLSYDVWEERFSVTRMRSTRASASRLTAQAAETWCLERFTFPSAGLPADKPLWVRVDVRAKDARDRQDSGDEGLSLFTLIDLFSKSARPDGPMQWRAESQPVTLAELRRTSGK
jgi:hypothetical protein